MQKVLDTIGAVEIISFPVICKDTVHARVDTGAKTSSISAKVINSADGKLDVEFIGLPGKPKATFTSHTTTIVASSNGQAEIRYKVQLSLIIAGRRLRAQFTLTDRSTQVYPVLIGRNVLNKKFVVDVSRGKPLLAEERRHTEQLRKKYGENL